MAGLAPADAIDSKPEGARRWFRKRRGARPTTAAARPWLPLSTCSLRLIHQIVERSIRHAQARDKVKRNVASLVGVPEGREGGPSKALNLEQAKSVIDAAKESRSRLRAYVIVCLLCGIRTEEARALKWSEVDLKAGTVAVYRSVRAKGETKTHKSPDGC